MSKTKKSIGAKILIALITILCIFAILIGGVFGFFYFVYKINIFNVANEFGIICQTVDIEKLAPNTYTQADLSSAYQKTTNNNLNVIEYNESTQTYTIKTDNIIYSGTDTHLNLDFTDKELASMINCLLNQKGWDIKIADINLADCNPQFHQIAFSKLNTENKTVDFNAVVSFETNKLLDSFNDFPMSLIKNRIPERVYLSATTTITQTGDLTYTIAGKSLQINNLNSDGTADLLDAVSKFVSIGSVEEYSKQICAPIINGIIGNDIDTGLTYAIKNIEIAGHSPTCSFQFIKDADNINYVITIDANTI